MIIIFSIISIRESGLYDNWINLFLKLLDNPEFIRQDNVKYELKFETMSFTYGLEAIYLLFFGIFIALILFFLEFIQDKCIIFIKT